MSALLTTQEVADLAGIAAPSVDSKMRRGGGDPSCPRTGTGRVVNVGGAAGGRSAGRGTGTVAEKGQRLPVAVFTPAPRSAGRLVP